MHVIPFIDDGADNFDDALKMLRIAYELIKKLTGMASEYEAAGGRAGAHQDDEREYLLHRRLDDSVSKKYWIR